MGQLISFTLIILFVFTLSILTAITLSRKRRYESLIMAVAKHMRNYHLSFYNMLEKNEERFPDLRFLIYYSRNVALLKQLDNNHWNDVKNIDFELLFSLFSCGESCLTELMLAVYNNNISYKEYFRLRRHYWKIRVLIPVLPQYNHMIEQHDTALQNSLV